SFDEFQFKRGIVTVSEDGVPSVKIQSSIEKIKVVTGWEKYKNLEQPFQGGYFNSGFSKDVFLGRFKNKDVAIAQLNKKHDEERNLEDLLQELKLIKLGQYFMNSFYNRVNQDGALASFLLNGFFMVILNTAMKWNVDDMFLGQVLSGEDIQRRPNENGSLTWPDFIVYAKLPDNGKFRKFSGFFEVQNNKDRMGEWVDAFGHHVVLDSAFTLCIVDLQGWVISKDDTLILFDPQANRQVLCFKMFGVWDDGMRGIESYMEQHECNTICEALGL
ncbi:hypothetical protein M422DRAFT_78268, partial [Sphaerobolus stellatus SS14]